MYRKTFYCQNNTSSINPLTTNVPHHIETSQMSDDLYCKSVDWFLYDGEHWLLMCELFNA